MSYRPLTDLDGNVLKRDGTPLEICGFGRRAVATHGSCRRSGAKGSRECQCSGRGCGKETDINPSAELAAAEEQEEPRDEPKAEGESEGSVETVPPGSAKA